MFTVILLIGCLMISPHELYASNDPAEEEWRKILPDSLAGWQRAEDKQYDQQGLYAYIDGGAELYLSYGFRSLFSRTYSRRNQPDLLVEIFDMGTPANAFGVFAHTRETMDSTFGQGSQYIAGSLLFWKDHYLFSLLGSPETEEARQAIFQLAGRLERAVPHPGNLPAILTLLPADSLVQSSIRYFHHYIWLNSYYFIADQNLLHIDQNCQALLARYKNDREDSALLLVIEYADERTAAVARDDFVKFFMPEAGAKGAVQMEDRSWVAYRLNGHILAVVFKGASREKAEHLLGQVEDRIKREQD
jgi:hypothetical protein